MGSSQTRGLLLGLVFGIVWMWLGFGQAVLIVALGLLGWLIGMAVSSIAAGNLNLADIWDDMQGRRRAGT